MRKVLVSVYIYIKMFFGIKLEGVDTVADETGTESTWIKRQKLNLWDLYNKEVEDRIDYTNTHKDHHSNFKHLDDSKDERFDRLDERVGLIYEEDGKTPFNAAEVYDMTYEQYDEYKLKILPNAKERKITMEEIEALFE